MYKTVRNLTVFSLGLGVSAIVGWLLLKESKRDQEAASVTVRSQSRTVEPDEIPQIVLPMEPIPETDAGQQDDFTTINGIGPRFAEALHAIGISRFAELAEQDPDDLANRLAAHATVRASRIRDNDWIGQERSLAQNQS
jgi:predicted flap endonuclease-1-like 5' DNA nuclease